MSDATSSPDPAPTSTAAAPAPTPPAGRPIRRVTDYPAFFAAIGNPLRWEMVKMMATGRALSASTVSKAVQRNFDGVTKHLRLLRKAGVIASRPGEDQRFELYYIPDSIRRADGALDYGFCALRIA